MYVPYFYCSGYYYPFPYSYQPSPYKIQRYFKNQGYYFPYKTEFYDKNSYFRQPDTLDIPENAKTIKLFPIGGEFFIPEFKIAQCDTNRTFISGYYNRGFNISMNQVKKAYKNAESSVKRATKHAWDELNKLMGNNDAEIKELEKQLREKYTQLGLLDCPSIDELETSEYCHTPEAQQIKREIRRLERKLKELKSKGNLWGSLSSSRIKFQDSLKELAQSEVPNINWPESWPTLEDIEYMPLVVQQHMEFPKTLKDMNIDSSLIQDITLPNNIREMINIPYDLDVNVDLDLKNQIQFEDAFHSVEQVLRDIANKAIEQLQQYNMCFFVKNSPYTLVIKLEYISSLKELIESYIYGCLEKAKNAALLVFAGYIPTIVSSYGASIPIAISNAFATYWTTLKKCLFDVYNAFKQEIENISNVQNFEGFLQVIEKYVSIDFTMEKRTIPWENKGSLVDLVTNVPRNMRSLPFSIDPRDEYIQSAPQFTPIIKSFTLDKESLKKIINKCGRHGMWIFVTFKNVNPQNPIIRALNVNSFENDILSGYVVTRDANGQKVRENLSISIEDIRNLECYNPSMDSQDNKNDLFPKTFNTDFCSTNKGEFFGKGFVDMDKGVVIYYEVYECGVYTGIYINGIFKSELYMPRTTEYSTNKHKYTYPTSSTSSNEIVLDIHRDEDELQQRLRIFSYESILNPNDIVDLKFWKIKLPW